ncbi:MAG: pilus assembly protein [Actinobacteria bacterium]|nr:pilus assembly protein [Actinomycetota bacterium]MCI0543252.1 pilus assembly protein [Actinomycetota bacterium]MCI0678340.1 pilus assembly protein [Actinomycetota bacterium]
MWRGMIRRRERGATIVESAIVFPLLFMVIFAVAEFGLAFKDWLTVSHSAREGARSGATFGNDPAADFLILDEVGEHLAPAAITVESVRIYNAATGVGTDYDYTPGANCSGSDCCDWTPCPDPDLPTPPYVVPNWDPTSRSVTAPDTDTIGVRVSFTHQWITGLFADTTVFTTEVEYHIEPSIFGP